MKHTVYYKKVFNASFHLAPPSVKSSDYEEIAVVDGRSLEDIFRKMNVVDGTELPAQLKVRNLFCGDVVITPDGQAWYCEPLGWERTTLV